MARRAIDEKERRVLRAVANATRIVMRAGWNGGEWIETLGLGPADVIWVQTVGLGRKHVAAATGTVRVAGRVFGDPMQAASVAECSFRD